MFKNMGLGTRLNIRMARKQLLKPCCTAAGASPNEN